MYNYNTVKVLWCLKMEIVIQVWSHLNTHSQSHCIEILSLCENDVNRKGKGTLLPRWNFNFPLKQNSPTYFWLRHKVPGLESRNVSASIKSQVMSSLSLGKAKDNRNADLEETRIFLIHQFISKWLKWSWDLLVLQFSILTNVFIPSLPPKHNCTEGQMKWEVWEWLIPIISFSLGSSCHILLLLFFSIT